MVVGPSPLEALARAADLAGVVKRTHDPGDNARITSSTPPVADRSTANACGTADVNKHPPSPVEFLFRRANLPRKWFARRLVRTRLMPAVFSACALLLAQAPAVLAHESEQYTLPVGRNFADLGPYFSRIVYDAIVGAVAETNAAISSAVDSQLSSTPLEQLQSSDYIAGKVWEHLFAAIPANELLDAILISEPVHAQFPGLVTMYRPVDSIYDDPLLVIDLTKVVRTFFRAGTVSAGGEVFGTDKIIHFINVGRIYHGKYETRIKRGLPEQEAIKSAIASTSRNLLTSEDGVLGMMTTGIHSNGDLAADYAGMQFYRNLTETIRIGSRTMPPMLARDGNLWHVQVQPDSDFFTAFITPHWNEVLNPSKYARYTSGRLRTLVRERCADAIDWYRDERGQPRGRNQFHAIEQDLASYYGAGYGHEGSPQSPVTIAAICFSGDGGGTAEAAVRDPDAFGRNALWRAARMGDTTQVMQLAVTRTDINAADLDGETALHAGVRGGNAAVVQELVARGADVNRAALYGVTPLMLAVAGGKPDVVTVLLRAGANPNSRDLFGKTPLHDAAQRGNPLMINALLKYGADPRIADDGGNTALHLAARRGNVTIAAMLFSRGADLQARNAVGATPRDVARSHWHWPTSERLAEMASAGANARAADRSTDSALAYQASAPGGSDATPSVESADSAAPATGKD
jgi:Ankyrin repeats (3 copies)